MFDLTNDTSYRKAVTDDMYVHQFYMFGKHLADIDVLLYELERFI